MRNFIFICQRRRELVLNLPQFLRFEVHVPINWANLLLLLFCGFLFPEGLVAQTAVTYQMQTSRFSTVAPYTSGGGIYNPTADELGMWANFGDKHIAAWRTFKTAGDDSGSNRPLQVGDEFKITVNSRHVRGEIGFSLNSGGSSGSSYANRTSGSRLNFKTENFTAWNAIGTTTRSLSYNPFGTAKNFEFTIKITSSSTANVFLTVDGTNYPANGSGYNLFMNGSGNIDSFSIYGFDINDGSSNFDVFWKQTSTVTNTKTVELGYFLASGTYTPGLISDGLEANSTGTSSVNAVLVGGDASSSVILSSANTYTGTTTVNSNATLRLGISSSASTSGPLGTTTNGTTVDSGGVLDLNGFSLTGSAIENLTLNGTGISNGGALINSSGTASAWQGNVSLGSNSLISGTGTITLNGVVSGSNALEKNGTGTLVLANTSNTYTGNTTINAGELRLNPTSTTATLASQIKLNGGKLGTSGIATGTTITCSSTLSLDANSTIELGSNNHSLVFANSSGVTWAGTTLTIYGWTGTAGISGTGGKLFFGVGGLSTAQLDKISFDGYDGKPILLPSGELVPSSVTVTSFTPTSGYSGTSIVITGTNFTGATAVSFGGTSAASFTVDSDTQITAIVGAGTSGNVSVTSPIGTGIRTGFTYVSGYVTKQNGDYNTASTWLLNAIPPAGANVIIDHAVTLSAAATNTPTSVTINTGDSLAFDNATSQLTTTTLTNNGTLSFTAAGTLNMASTGTITNNSTFTAGNGLVNFAGAGTVNGSSAIAFNNITINGTVTLATIPTINGIFTISGGNVTAAPTYGNVSTLIYNTGGPYGVSFEWTGNATTAGSGVPQNVIINNSTSLTMPNASRGIAGNLNITSGTLALSGTVSADLYIAGNWTRASGAIFTPNARAVFFNGSTTQVLTVTGGGTETFNYLVISGSGTLQLATGTNATVNTSNGVTLSSTNATSTIDLNGQTFTISGGGNLSLASGNRKITSSLAGGVFRVNTSQLTITNPGTLELDTATTLVLETGLNFGAGNPTTINGTLQLNTNSYVDVNAPKYGSASSLIYNSGGTYGKRIEWTSNIGGTFGVPHHVTLTNNTTLEYDYDTIGPRGMTGNLTLNSGSKLQMGDCDGALTVMGSIVCTGELALGIDTGDDLKVGGDITFNTGYTFNANNRAVFFIKNASSGTQTINAPVGSPPTFHYVVFEVPSSGNATVVLNTDLSITAPNTGNVISFGSANDILDLNGRTLTLGTASTNNIISGSGTFKGSNTSNMTLLGNGSIGTMNFTSGSQILGNLTVNRQDNAIAMKLGTPLTINTSLTLTKGLVDLDTFDMSLNLSTTASGGPTSYVIVDEAGTSGRLRKRVTLANNTFTFPIGDNAASANGSQYTPATVSFTAGTFSTAYMMVSVNDIKHPEMEASTDYLTRYWKLSSTGITGAATYIFSGKYHSTPANYDVAGTESNSKPGRWNGIQWTEGPTAIDTTANTLEITVTDGGATSSINELSAGFPLGAPEINVVGNDMNIVDGDTTPDAADFTDFGDSPATRSSTFLIQNLAGAKGNLEINNVTISGIHASDFSITTSPASLVAVGGTTYLVIKFTPSGPGIRTATVTIENNDPDENPYTFNIQGQGIDYIECAFRAEETIAVQDFEDSPATPTWGYTTPLPAGATVTGGTAYGASGDGGSSAKFIGAKSLQVSNASTEIVFDAIDTSHLSDVNLSMRVGAFSVTSGNGMEANDVVRVSISKDGGTTWTNELSVSGFSSNCRWSFTSGTGIGVTVYDGNGTIENQYKPQAGGFATTDGYSTLRITNLPLVNSLRMKITIVNDTVGEIWAVDNIELKAKRKASKTWNGTVWSGDGNPPTSTQVAIIDGNYDSSTEGAGFIGCECEVNSGNTLTIASNHTLDIQSDFTNNGIVIFEDSSSLLQHNNNAINTGNVTIKRNTQPVYRYDFTYWSSPLFANDDPSDDATEDAFTLKELSPMTLFDKYFKWNHAAVTPVWQTIPVGAEVMVPGRGYIVRAPQYFDIQGQSGATAEVYTANFIGKPNNGIVEHAVTGSDTVDKWNLLGNPYPSAINIEEFLLSNNQSLEGTIYLWTHNSQIQETGIPGVFSYNPSDYATFNFSGATATAAASTGGVEPDEFLASGQSFFVKGINPLASNVTFNNSMRVSGNNDQFFRPNTTQPINNWQTSGKHRIWLNLTGQNAFNQTMVGYIEGATNGKDWGYDGESFGGNRVTLYSLLADEKMVIQGRALPFNNQDQVPLGYKTTLTGSLKISIDHYDGLFEGQDIYLEDLLLNVVHDLKNSDYTFTTIPGTFNNRFVLRYLPNETLSNPELEKNPSSIMIWKNQDDLNVKSTFPDIRKITIYDILGRKVFEQDDVNESQFSTSNVVYGQQTLIVKVELNDHTIITKKVIF
ncbi:autotransporter-associated beta strand protein [Flavobacterium arsenatis]|uniref:Autotransporter-associated beta strand protein n=1 Tax=Flavobacterium arsenatis TaxID=1484332 RepID=A0ABU1TLB9_9FLAO|nr:choice-of-anchor D domain-containing protein [Flavobacterium arsenatis]MDR6966765.1 autotransporter-associated beta strand protein [Flavobacterium arsenatis]